MTGHLAFGLEGKVVMVTGGAGAIGRAVCEGFAEAGARVVVVDVEDGAAGRVAGELGACHRALAADLRDAPSLDPLVERAEREAGPIDALVNMAGVILRTSDLLSVTERDWDAQYDVNIKGLFFLSQAVARRMIGAGREGAIVNYTSQGWMSGGFAGSVVYNSAKGAVTTITRGMARSWAPHAIRVNAVAPGLVETPMLVGPGTTAEQRAALDASVPLGRIGVPGDHVGATVFLASRMARYMTGATVNVSGGFLMY